MKKILKKISICFVAFMCLITTFGCSCEKRLKIKYIASISPENEFGELNENIQIYMEANVEKKFREPAGTKCYTKDGTLVTDTSVYKCYNEDGTVEFERATAAYKEKMKVEANRMLSISKQSTQKDFESDYIKMPNNENYSLIYKFTITNTSENTRIYIAKSCLSEESIFGQNTFREDLQEGKISFSISGLKEEGEYYYLDGFNHGVFQEISYEKIEIIIELKNLTNKDLRDSRNKTLDLNFNLLVK